jgi:hypothetical protein
VEKVVEKCGLLLQLKKLPKVIYHPMGKNSPNLVTLPLGTLNLKSFGLACFETGQIVTQTRFRTVVHVYL